MTKNQHTGIGLAIFDGATDGPYMFASLLATLILWGGFTMASIGTGGFIAIIGIISVFTVVSTLSKLNDEIKAQASENHIDQRIADLTSTYTLLTGKAPDTTIKPSAAATPSGQGSGSRISKTWRYFRVAASGLKNGNRVITCFTALLTFIVGATTGTHLVTFIGIGMGVLLCGGLLASAKHNDDRKNRMTEKYRLEHRLKLQLDRELHNSASPAVQYQKRITAFSQQVSNYLKERALETGKSTLGYSAEDFHNRRDSWLEVLNKLCEPKTTRENMIEFLTAEIEKFNKGYFQNRYANYLIKLCEWIKKSDFKMQEAIPQEILQGHLQKLHAQLNADQQFKGYIELCKNPVTPAFTHRSRSASAPSLSGTDKTPAASSCNKRPRKTTETIEYGKRKRQCLDRWLISRAEYERQRAGDPNYLTHAQLANAEKLNELPGRPTPRSCSASGRQSAIYSARPGRVA